MRELPKSEWKTGDKRQWSTPKMREIPVTDEILARLKLAESGSLTDVGAAKKAAAGR